MPAKIPTTEWLKDKLNRLEEMTEVVKKISPELYSEVDPDYGFWSIKKEIALMYWSYPFQHIAKNHFESFYYIDLFAGSGLMKAENSFFVGSPVVAVNSTIRDKGFSKYICIEQAEDRKEVLEKRLNKVCEHHQTCDPTVVQGDCNKEILNALKEHAPKGNTCFLAFVDPQSYSQLNWSTLETLMSYGKGDIILNFPTMGLTRNLNNAECRRSISAFVGDDFWIEEIGQLNIDSFLDYFLSKMKRFRSEVHSLKVKDERNHRLFDLVFATGSTGMNNALADLTEKLDAFNTKTIKGIYSVVAKGQTQMQDFYSQ
jgi:three-Cys-motif partner protein